MNFLAGKVSKKGYVKVGDLTLTTDTQDFAIGDDVNVAVRPENIIVQEGAGRHKNVVPAIVKEMEFLGSFYRATLVSAKMGDLEFEADFSINMTRRTDVKVGQKIKIIMQPDRILLYPKGGES